mmetsp:Transcript_2630/g.4396  ORF Transcript_2630/g.4396 Transcript_2630/m.4396 type:complete len:84 (+) Transcript_2630:594-845(+)
MLDETVPIYMASSFGTATNSLMSFGIMVAIVLAVVLPENGDYQGQMDDGWWRLIYGFPYVFQFLMILMLMTCYPQDSIGYCIS